MNARAALTRSGKRLCSAILLLAVLLGAAPARAATQTAAAARGRNLADSAEARGFFRTIYVGGNVNAGTWKLRLENTGTLDTTVVISAWSDAVTKKF
jgi:hypothetical protein